MHVSITLLLSPSLIVAFSWQKPIVLTNLKWLVHPVGVAGPIASYAQRFLSIHNTDTLLVAVPYNNTKNMKVIAIEIIARLKIKRKFSCFHRNAKDMLDDRFTWVSAN